MILTIQIISFIMIIAAIGIFYLALRTACQSIRFLTKKDIRCLPFLGFFSGLFIFTGMLLCTEPKRIISVETICDEYAISYELVETVAEYLDYSEREVAQFFIIVADDMEPYDAIALLDHKLTEEQIEALLELSSIKQAE